MGDYQGKERRHQQRRQNPDRRNDFRWEPEKEDRRHGNGRRDTDNGPNFWNGPNRSA